MAEANRGPVLSTVAVLFALLAVSNLLKPILEDQHTGFVFFGQRLTGTANAIAGPLFGIYLLVYAWGIWRMKRFAIPMGHAYALYVLLNLILYVANNPRPPGASYVIFMIVYALVAVGVSVGAAVMITKRKAELT